MNFRKPVIYTSSKLNIWKPCIMVLLIIQVLSMSHLLTGCKLSEGQSGQSGKAKTVTFDLLSGYDYEKGHIPERIKALDGQKVAVTGFMFATLFDKTSVKGFLLMKDQNTCCFGAVPNENDFIDVEMSSSKGVRYIPDVPVTVVGKLSVGEKFLVNSIYRMEADNVVAFDGF